MKDRIAAVFVALLGVAVWWRSTVFPTLDDGHPGPALFPRVIAIGLVAAGVGLLIRRPEAPAEEQAEAQGRAGWTRLTVGLVMVAIFPLMRTYLGFVVALTVLGLSVALVLGARWRTAVPVVVISALVVYWLFTGLLGVPL